MMKFLKFIRQKKFTMACLLMSIYIISSLLEGERGLFSYYKKQEIKKELVAEKNFLNKKLALIERKNNLLTSKIDLDYLEILFRKKFLVGKSDEKIYILK